jgi:tetratricopeptide (TPR) repeat protein
MATERLKRQIERLLDEAEQAVSQLNWRVVKARAEAVLAFDPGNGDAQAFLAAADRALETAGGPLPETPPLSLSTAAVSSAQPTSFANGRYQVKKFLGEGGKKKVYLAHDTLLDRDVAFALIKTQGLDEVSRTRITREAQAMGRLGDHPHIMPIYDLGQEAGQPYMVLPLMSGGDVEGLVKKAPERRISLERAMEITQQVCRGLQFAHDKGIVHRDLKPGNVWLTSDGVAKIGDFGLALPLDRPRMTLEGMMVGTVDYMPPEQAMGGETTPRADLYSLGAMLYEMVTGRPPFLGDDAVAIIGQHINTPPVAPTWHNGQCPRPLEALILRLLAKDPAQRPESAADVLAALEGVDLTDVPLETNAAPGESHALESLAGGVFVGRQREMGELKAALEEALSGQGRLAMLVGEPGIGKTRTAQELATYAGLRQCQVLWGRCYEGQGAPPYWPWVQAIRSYVRSHEEADLRSQMGSGAADIAEIVSDVKERFPDLKPPPQLEPEQARFRLFDSIASFLKGASRKQPLVVVLDDLHWADKPSLALLQFVARELGNGRVLLLGTYRDMELSRQHPLAETLGDLTKERLFQRILLRGLSQEDVARFIEMTTGSTAPQGLAQAVYTHTEGNPLFVTEVVRLLVQEGNFSAHPEPVEGRGSTSSPRAVGRPDTWTVRIPEGVREVIGRRLNRLSQRCNQTLTTAAIIGREFSLEQLKPLIDDTTDDWLLEALEEALAARVIEELPRSVGRYQFSHALIQETLAGELSTTRKVRLHARIAQALEKLYGQQAEAHAAELARHFAEAESVLGIEKLVKYSLLAGEKALAACAWEEALQHFQRGLESKGVRLQGIDPAKDAETAALLFGLARAQLATLERHEMREAIPSLRRAFDHYIQAGDIAQAIAVVEYPAPSQSELFFELAQLLSRALTLVPSDSHAAGRLLSAYGRCISFRGDYQATQQAFQRALAIARRERDMALEVRTLAFAARGDSRYLRYGECVEKSLRAIELARSVDEPRIELQAGVWGAESLMALGELEQARRLTETSLALAERLRRRYELVIALRTQMTLSRLEGDWPAARESGQRGLAVSPNDATLLSQLALLEYQLGNFGQGEAYLDQWLELAGLTSPGHPSASFALPAVVIPVVARIAGTAGRTGMAQETAKAVLTAPSVDLFTAVIARAGLALLAAQRSDGEAAREQYTTLEPQRGTILEVADVAFDRLLGLLAQTTGNLDKAAQHFEDALAFCRKAGYRPELAWTCCDYADTLLARNQPGDRQKAISLLDECLRITRELGMRPLLERALSRREILRA